MADTAVIVFLRAPEPGRVKTRLAATLDQGLVLDLYKAFVLDTLAAAAEFGSPFVFFTPAHREQQVRAWLGQGCCYFPQQGSDLGRRMADAFETVFKTGVKTAVLVGTDIPQLTPAVLGAAFGGLEQHSAVLGPASDGGYYLIGFRKEHFSDTVFHGIAWSSPTVLQQTTAAMDCSGIAYQLLDTLIDIDTRADLETLASLATAGRPVGRQTLFLLRRCGFMGPG